MEIKYQDFVGEIRQAIDNDYKKFRDNLIDLMKKSNSEELAQKISSLNKEDFKTLVKKSLKDDPKVMSLFFARVLKDSFDSPISTQIVNAIDKGEKINFVM